MIADNKRYPKVSVITVCLNSVLDMEGAIKSVCTQTYPHIEYIVIDGGSSDGSAQLFNRYKDRIDRLVVEKDNGIFDAMNKGIKVASGDIIYFLNSDDKLHDPNVIEKVVEAFKNNSKADFVYGNLVAFDPKSGASYIEKYPKRISRWLFIRKTIGHPAAFFRSSCFDKVGYFKQEYRIGADYEWCLRAVFLHNLKSVYIDDIISIFRLGGNSSLDNGLEEYFSERILIQKQYFNAFEILYTRLQYAMRRMSGRSQCA